MRSTKGQWPVWLKWKKRHRGAFTVGQQVGRVSWSIFGLEVDGRCYQAWKKIIQLQKWIGKKWKKKQESMCFVVFRCQRKKGSKTFFEPFFTFCLIFFIARGNISRTTRMASGFSLGPGSLVSIHCFSSTEAPITWGGWSPIRRILEQRRMGSSPIVGSLGFEFFFFPSKHAIDILFWSSLDMLVSKKPDI